MIENKQLLGKLNLDDSPYKMGREDYVDAMAITKDAIESGSDVAVTNIVGNTLVDNPFLRKIYTGNSYDIVLTTAEDSDKVHQNVYLSFNATVNASGISYYDGITWTDVYSSSNTSPQTFSIPKGDYNYKAILFLTSSPSYFDLTEQTTSYKCIGALNWFPKCYYFLYNSDNYHLVLDYDIEIGSLDKIFENLSDSGGSEVLTFLPNKKINNINVYPNIDGDFLFFLDSGGRPTYINVTRFKNKEYIPVTRDILDVCTAPPLIPISCVYNNDTSKHTNDLRNKFFRFKYRFVYDDNQKSTFSPISAMPIPINLLDDTFTNVITNNNVITLQIYSGAKNVKSIEIAVSYVNKTNDWSDFMLVDNYNKLSNSVLDNAYFSYQFYNDGTYPNISITESIQLYDYVPDVADVQEMPNGNHLVYGAITEGYDNDLVPNVVNTVNTYLTTGGGISSLSSTSTFVRSYGSLYYEFRLNFTGSLVEGTSVIVKLQKVSDNSFVQIMHYTTVIGDTLTTLRNHLISSKTADVISANPLPPAGIELTFLQDFKQLVDIEITPPYSSFVSNSTPTWKWSTQRRIGISYFDKKGKTNGVVYNSKILFPAYSENISGAVFLPYINSRIYHVPPIWAYSYQFLFTKEPTQYLFWETIDARVETEYIYFNITNLFTNQQKIPTVTKVLSYTFQDGDRMRLIKNTSLSHPTVYNDTYDVAIEGLVVNPYINGVLTGGGFNTTTNTNNPDAYFIKVKNINPLTPILFETDKTFVIELYRNGQQLPNNENAVFYELGVQYAILNPTTNTRVHQGQVTDQSTDYSQPAEVNFYNGDSYFRLRTIFTGATDQQGGYARYYCQDRNVTDIYLSAVSSVDGRPSIIDVNAKRQYFGALVRFSEAYQPNTNINGLNRFYSNNFDEYDYSYGNIARFKVRDRAMRVFQNLKVGVVPLYNQISKNADGTQLLVVTDKLLNPIQYYAGDYGIGEQPESLASFTFADYFTSNVKGAICRVSNNGVEPISLIHKINSWGTKYLPLRIGDYKVYGVFDQRLNNYIIALEEVKDGDTVIDNARTLSFDEENNGFESFLPYSPEMMCGVGTLLITFKDGSLYTHNGAYYNTFYGTTYDSNITPIFNQGELEKKTYLSVSEVASEVWDCPEITTSLNSFGTTKQQSTLIEEDFETKEGVHHASFLRDSNSIGGIIDGDALKGNYISVKFRKKTPTELVSLNVVSLKYIDSPLTNR